MSSEDEIEDTEVPVFSEKVRYFKTQKTFKN